MSAQGRGYCDGLLSTGCSCPWTESGHGTETVRTTHHTEACRAVTKMLGAVLPESSHLIPEEREAALTDEELS